MIIIPARLASTRFKDKIFCDIGGVPMFVATAKRVAGCDEVVVAVDDRIDEAARILGLSGDELIINVQADEPFIEPENIAKFIEFCKARKNEAFMFSCYKPVESELADDKNLVKVVTDDAGSALYFSRSRIPFNRARCDVYKAHLGIYGYDAKNLREFCSFAPSFLENVEKLEQLRALQNGKKIAMLEVKSESIGIDSEQDYERAKAKFGF